MSTSMVSTDNRPRVIGIYGLPGSGKTTIATHLMQALPHSSFVFFEGSEVITNVFGGTLEQFKQLPDNEKTTIRNVAADYITNECTNAKKAGIVTGHFSFWKDGEENAQVVCTDKDLQTYTHAIYLDVPAGIIASQRRNDTQRERPPYSAEHLAKWQKFEKRELRRLCREHGILFAALESKEGLRDRVVAMVRDFHVHTEALNRARVEAMLKEIVEPQWETVMVIDGDRTLAEQDAGVLFWDNIRTGGSCVDEDFPTLKEVFSRSGGYSYDNFRQVTLLHEEALDEKHYEETCRKVAEQVVAYPEFVALLSRVSEVKHIGVVVASCGLRHVWERVVERLELADTVKVIAGGRISDGLVVTPDTKAELVTGLRNVHRQYVWAFGDSPMDLQMLKEADQAIVVVGDEGTRSKTMDDALAVAIQRDTLKFRQVLLPSSVPPRLNPSILAVVKINDADFIGGILDRRGGQFSRLSIHFPRNPEAAKLLATPMRDSAIAGPYLRLMHHRAGAYLATELLTDIIGLEECNISHVLGCPATGHRLKHEQHTTIIALMRACEPMASGVSETFPLAMFVHAGGPGDVKLHHLEGQQQVLLVDAVINSGGTVLDFVQRIRQLSPAIPIAVVAGTVQARCLGLDNTFHETLAAYGNVSLAALRKSETKFTGSGVTDTGNRLFNTTHLKR